MNDLFSVLTQGVKFSSKKHGEAMGAFKTTTSNKRSAFDFLDDSNNGPVSSSLKIKKIKNTNEDTDSKKIEWEPQSLDNEEEINAFRNKLHIKVNGGAEAPPPAPSFQEMNISKEIKSIILHNIEESKWKEPTPIQMQAIPSMLLGKDVLATAPTGSGKTAAFVIPTLSMLKTPSKQKGIRAIFIAPTKELAEQIHREIQRLCQGRKFKICLLKKSTALTAIASQSKKTLSKFDAIVTTPMRLLSIIRSNAVDLSNVEMVILDEVDKLFELESGNLTDTPVEEEEANAQNETRSSFLTQIDEILHNCPSTIQCGLFSATIGPLVQELASTLLKSPIRISIGITNTGASTINQKLTFVGREEGKLLAIRQIIQQGIKPPVLIFLQSKDRAKELFRELVYDGIHVDVIHSERTAQQREEIIKRFRIGEIWVLICTDLMARGVDFKGVNMVINYDLPQTAVSYIHRIGRTGRANMRGEAVTFFTEDDIPRMRPIANVMKLSGCDVPEFLLNIKQMTTKEKRTLRRNAPDRRSITTVTKNDLLKGKRIKLAKQQRQQKEN